MFENFLFSVNIVLPMVLIAVLGYFLKRVGMLGESFVSNTSKLLFNVVVPLSIFNSIAYSDLSETFDLKQVLFTCISTIAVTVIVGLITPPHCQGPLPGGYDGAGYVSGKFRNPGHAAGSEHVRRGRICACVGNGAFCGGFIQYAGRYSL
jgi:hypothetical protein